MPLLARWFARPPVPLNARGSAASSAADVAAPAEADVPPKGSAWFESSHDLMQGLLVVEEPPGWRLVPRQAGAAGRPLRA